MAAHPRRQRLSSRLARRRFRANPLCKARASLPDVRWVYGNEAAALPSIFDGYEIKIRFGAMVSPN
jgi:hypothetical protein